MDDVLWTWIGKQTAVEEHKFRSFKTRIKIQGHALPSATGVEEEEEEQ